MRHTALLLVVLILFTTINTDARADDLRAAGDVLQPLLPAIGLATTVVLKDWPGTKEWVLSAATTLVLTQAAKFTVEKWRPDDSDPDSFPSGHSSSAWFGAAFVDRRYGWKFGVPMYVLAATTSFSRVKADKHFTEDVYVGALIAVLSCRYIVTPYHNVNVTPQVDARGIGVSVAVNF